MRFKSYFFFIPYHHIGGAESVHLNIIKSLKRKPVIFFEKHPNIKISKEFLDNAYCFSTGYKRKKKIILWLIKIYASFSSVTIFGSNSPFFYTIVNKINCKNIRKIDLTHAFSYPDKGIETLSLPSVNLLDKRIVINNKTFKDYQKLYSDCNINSKLLERILVIPNGIDIHNFDSNKINLRYKNFKVGYVGRNSPEKRPELFFKIIGKLNINAKIIGDDFTIFKKEFPNLEYFENCNNKEIIREQFSDISLLLVTSSREGFPLVIMEAMELGIPVLSTDVGSVSEHITNQFNGFLAPNDVESFIDFATEIIKKLSSDEKFYFSIASHARKYAENNFGLERFTKNYRKLFYE